MGWGGVGWGGVGCSAVGSEGWGGGRRGRLRDFLRHSLMWL